MPTWVKIVLGVVVTVLVVVAAAVTWLLRRPLDVFALLGRGPLPEPV